MSPWMCECKDTDRAGSGGLGNAPGQVCVLSITGALVMIGPGARETPSGVDPADGLDGGSDDDDVYYYNGWRLKLKGKAKKTCFCAKKRISVKAVLRGHSLHFFCLFLFLNPRGDKPSP